MSDHQTTVFYDGACPLCRREIDFYRRRNGAGELAWVDVSLDDANLPAGLTIERARARFHVLDVNGSLLSGGAAFAHLWTRLPSFRWAGRIGSMRPMIWLLDHLYNFFLRYRPGLQRLFA